jgi:hypothetical protein
MAAARPGSRRRGRAEEIAAEADEVGAVAAADLDHLAGEAGETSLAVLAHDRVGPTSFAPQQVARKQ